MTSVKEVDAAPAATTLGENISEKHLDPGEGEAINDSPTESTDEVISNDLSDLLSLKVSKDYINCVWTTEPHKSVSSDAASAHGKVSVTDCSSPAKQQESLMSQRSETPKAVEVADNKKLSEPETEPASKKKKISTVKKQKKDVTEQVTRTAKSKRNREHKQRQCNSKGNSLPSAVSSVSASEPPRIQNQQKKKAKETSKEKHQDSKNFAKSENSEHALPTDDNLFEAYKNLVVHRSLPPYSPKEINTQFFSGTYFCCKACGDKYLMQTSLEGHMARKTAKFAYTCTPCLIEMCFYNKCCLQIHLMSHGMTVDDIKSGDLVVLPLSPEESECDALFKNLSCNLSPCPECSKLVSSLKMHLLGSDNSDSNLENKAVDHSSTSLSCKECFFVSPTKCAFSAHERYHKCEPPYVCPECGDSFLRSATLISHMDEICFHNQKRTVFQCTFCRVIVLSIDLFSEHLIENHLQAVYVCHACGTSSKKFEDFNAHRMEKHGLSSVEPLSGTAALCARVECDKCPGVSISRDSLQDHAVSHTVDPKFMTSVYQCKACKCMFGNHSQLLSHKATCKGNTQLPSHIPNEIRFSDLPDDMLYSFQPAVLSEISHSEQGLPVKLEPGSKLGSPIASEECKDTNHPLDQHHAEMEWEHLDGGVSEGSQSVAGQGGGIVSKSQVNVKDIFDIKKNVVCKLCRKFVCFGMNKAAVKKHFTKEHFDIFMKAVHGKAKERLPMQIVYPQFKEPLKAKKRKNNADSKNTGHGSSVANHRVFGMKRKGGKRLKRPKSPVIGEGQILEIVQKEGFECYKCLFQSGDAETFKDHILTHKSNPSDLQCPECGLCFIVRPPLEKHLIVKHGIQNVSKFMMDHGFKDDFSDEEEKIDVEESHEEILQENQCKVCKEKFDSSLLLEKHFRVHGGAFLLASLKAKRSTQTNLT